MSVSKTVAQALQQAVVDLNVLALVGKQLHWNIEGEGFRNLHLALDEIVDLSRAAYDEFAERLVALGGSPDARALTLSAADLPEVDSQRIPTDKGYAIAVDYVQKVADRLKSQIDVVDAEDHLSADLFIGTARDLEKQAWFLRAEGF